MNRRQFLTTGLALAAAGARSAADGAKPRLVVARSEEVFAGPRGLDQDAAQDLVDKAVARLLGEADATAAWKRLVKPDRVVAIKVNCLAGERLSTRIEVVRAVADGVRRAGVPGERIFVWDRKRNDLARAAYPLDERTAFRCAGNDDVGFGRRLILKGEIGSLFSKLALHPRTAIINVPVLKDHDLAGVTAALKSFFGAIHNPNKYHFANLHQAIVDVNRVEPIRQKTVLHLCDATFACYHTGPTPQPRFIERLGMIAASRDPVALDRYGWQTIEGLRKAHQLPSLVGSPREPKHIALGAKAGLGTDDLARVETIEV